jgi:putative nucleotidyltransferase with HDIG domain
MAPKAQRPTSAQTSKSTRDKLRVLFDRVAELCDLPPLPAVATRAMALARDPEVKTDDLAAVVQTDAAIALRVLRISRSALYVRRKPPETLKEAIATVGLDGLRKILVAASARSAYRVNDAVSQSLWRHALATALAADELAARTGKARGGPSFIAGLMHDVGRLVFHLSDPAAYTALGHPTVELEERTFGVSHAAVGACLAEQWELDDEVVEAVMMHHTGGSPLADRLWVADRIAHEIGFGTSKDLTPAPAKGPAVAIDVTGVAEKVAAALAAESALFD